jgi:aminopeptidase YwaD
MRYFCNNTNHLGMMRILLLLLIAISVQCQAQSKKKKQRLALQQQLQAAALLASNLTTHLQTLAGYTPSYPINIGNTNEPKTIGYLIQQYQIMGIPPLGSDSGSYVQPFVIDDGKYIIDSATFFTVNEKPLQLRTDFFPLATSRSSVIKGAAALAMNERKQPWFKDLKDLLEDNNQNLHFNLAQSIQTEAEKAAKKGALALCLYNTSKQPDNIQFLQYDTSYVAAIPVIYITKQGISRFFKDYAAFQQLHLGVAIGKQYSTAKNVVAYINNHANNTVVLGAYYHYLSNPLTDSLKAVSGYQANNNIGGTAVLLELARLLNTAAAKNNNYILIHFSGKASTALGSKHWLQKPAINPSNINYMFNINMLDQYDTLPKLTIGGVGTSPIWTASLQAAPAALPLQLDSGVVATDEHTCFYRAGIPVLSFGAIKPTSSMQTAANTTNHLNIEPQRALVQYLYQLVLNNNTKGKLPYAQTAEVSK